MLQKSSFRSQSGQVAVVVFLIMAVLLVVGLSLAWRTSQEIELAGQQEDTTRVFNAAESGIEEALSDEANFVDGHSFTSESIPNTETNVSIEAEDFLRNTFQPGETATVFTEQLATPETLNIRWDKTAAGCSSVLVVTAYYTSGTTVLAEHTGIRPLGCSQFAGTQFTESNQNSALNGYKYRHQLSVPPNTQLVRIKPLYAATELQVESSSLLSEQQHIIRSVAEDSTGESKEVRAIEVTRSRPAPPSILDYALYSGGTLVKN